MRPERNAPRIAERALDVSYSFKARFGALRPERLVDYVELAVVNLTITQTVDVACGKLWAVLEDHASYDAWGPWSEASLEVEGSPERNGVGAVRRLRADPRTVLIEEVVAFEPPRRLAYVLKAGLPIRDYRADVTLTPLEDGKTSVRWQSEFRPAIFGTGWLIRRRLRAVYEDVIARLARYAQRVEMPQDCM